MSKLESNVNHAQKILQKNVMQNSKPLNAMPDMQILRANAENAHLTVMIALENSKLVKPVRPTTSLMPQDYVLPRDPSVPLSNQSEVLAQDVNMDTLLKKVTVLNAVKFMELTTDSKKFTSKKTVPKLIKLPVKLFLPYPPHQALELPPPTAQLLLESLPPQFLPQEPPQLQPALDLLFPWSLSF